MSYFVVTREAGPAWIEGKGSFEQPAVDEHAAYMNTLADDGVLVFAGPLAGSEHGHIRVLLIASADNEDEIRGRLADDPWTRSERLITSSIESWSLIVGAERISSTTGDKSRTEHRT